MPRTLITCALPYANGPVHLGHLVEHIQTDVHVRFLRSAGEEVLFLCADDTHGAPIEVNALKQGMTPEQFVAQWDVEHRAVFRDFGISHDHYGSTNSPENRHYAEYIYGKAKEAGSIGRKEIEQPYDEKSQRWLSDRFIRGTCPNCGTADQYGDACESCNATYTPRELKDARSALSGEPLVWKKSEHLFFLLSKHEAFLREQVRAPGFMNAGLAQQLQQFFDKGLADWDITRDGPYFGFQIPGEPNKFFYVWLDAPIGYIAATEQWGKKTGKLQSALDAWAEGADTRIVHTIGKDIVYFHCLFWPAVLKVAGLKRPAHVHIHGHLTVNGQKMSKSRGTFINARPYLDLLDPSYLRFYFASLLGNGPEDLDFSPTEFRDRVNSGLVNNLGNLANRSLSLLAGEALGHRHASTPTAEGKALLAAALARVPEVRAAYAAFDSRAAVRVILEIGQSGNLFLTQHEPWKKLKGAEVEHARAVLSDAAEVVALVATLLQPVVPALSDKLFAQLGIPPLTFAAIAGKSGGLLDRSLPVGEPSPVIGRVDEAVLAKLLVPPGGEAPGARADATGAAAPGTGSAAAAPKAEPVRKPAPEAPAPAPSELDYADFAKVVLRSGKIVAAEKVAKADKLLKLTVEVGEPAPRTIVSGIAEAYAPEAVVGRNVVVVMNLKPRSLRGIESRGMILTAGPGGKELVLLHPGEVPPGSEVK